MSSGSAPQVSDPSPERAGVIRLGGWLFKRRSWLPIPIALVLLLLQPSIRATGLVWLGLALVALGEAVRLWAVHHIGVISRTRSERLGPLISTGPFGHVRNPLYLGNIALWLGFTIAAGLLWLAPIVLVLLAVEYHAIVRWEEELLLARMGSPYRDYVASVPRWIPRARSLATRSTSAPVDASASSGYSLLDSLASERSTLIAIALGMALIVSR